MNVLWSRYPVKELRDESAMDLSRVSDKALVGRFLDLVEGFSGPRIRGLTNGKVTEHDVSRWNRKGAKRVSPEKRQAMEAYVMEASEEGDDRKLLLMREGRADYEDAAEADTLFQHFEGMVRRMGGAGVNPEELQLRKLDVTEGLKRLYAAQGNVPAWVYDLERRIRAGEL